MCIASPIRYKRSAFMLAVYALFLCSSAQSTERGREIRFDTLAYPGAVNTLAFDINNRGVVVGSFYRGAGPVGFVAMNDLLVALDRPVDRGMQLWAINDRGHIVGATNANGGIYEAFLMRNGVATPLEYPGQRNSWTFPSGINNRQHVVGTVDNSFGFLWKEGKFTDIRVSEYGYTRPSGINDRGQIVGDYQDNTSCVRGFLIERDTTTTFSIPDTCFTRPTAINNLGQIVGSYFRSDEEGNSITTGFIYWKGRFTVLHIPGSNETEITGINDRGNVVGWYVTDAGQYGFETNVYQFLRQRR